MQVFRTAINGLGNIGMGFDFSAPPGGAVLSHAAAFAEHPGFELVAGVDPDAEKRLRFTEKFKAPAFPSLKEIPFSAAVDVIAIASPTPFHREDVLAALERGPKGIFCEKPLALSTADGEEMIARCKAGNCLMGVNYIRRFEPGTLEMKKRIAGGSLGVLRKGTVWYTKGLYNNASHFIDLLIFIFGMPVSQRVLRNNRFWQGVDPEPDFVLTWDGGADIHFIALPAENYSLTEMTLAFDRGMVRYQGGGADLTVYMAAADPVFAGYTVLDSKGEKITTDFQHYQRHAAAAFYQALTGGLPMASSAASALETLKITEAVHREIGL